MKNVLVALIVAVVLGAGALYLQGGALREASQPAVSGVVNAPEPAPVDPAPYLAAFPLTPLEAPPVTGSTRVAKALDKALVPYRRGDYAAAASALDGVKLDHPDDPTVTLYLGIARLFIDEPANALEILQTMPPNATPEVAGEAAWYSVVGIARLRNPTDVEARARTLCASPLPTAPRACDAIARLSTAQTKP